MLTPTQQAKDELKHETPIPELSWSRYPITRMNELNAKSYSKRRRRQRRGGGGSGGGGTTVRMEPSWQMELIVGPFPRKIPGLMDALLYEWKQGRKQELRMVRAVGLGLIALTCGPLEIDARDPDLINRLITEHVDEKYLITLSEKLPNQYKIAKYQT